MCLKVYVSYVSMYYRYTHGHAYKENDGMLKKGYIMMYANIWKYVYVCIQIESMHIWIYVCSRYV